MKSVTFLVLSLAATFVAGHYSHSSEERGGRESGRPSGGGRGGCPGGWLRFQRPNGVWCVLVGHSAQANGMLSQSAAESICQTHGATLTGFQNSAERMAVANEGLKHIAQLKKLVGGLWIGATPNPGCNSGTSCGAYNMFRWTDGHTTGTAGFTWGAGEPDNAKWPGLAACIQQLITHPSFASSTAGLPTWRSHFRHGDLDKYQCGTPAGPAARLYACGKPGRR